MRYVLVIVVFLLSLAFVTSHFQERRDARSTENSVVTQQEHGVELLAVLPRNTKLGAVIDLHAALINDSGNECFYIPFDPPSTKFAQVHVRDTTGHDLRITTVGLRDFSPQVANVQQRLQRHFGIAASYDLSQSFVFPGVGDYVVVLSASIDAIGEPNRHMDFAIEIPIKITEK